MQLSRRRWCQDSKLVIGPGECFRRVSPDNPITPVPAKSVFPAWHKPRVKKVSGTFLAIEYLFLLEWTGRQMRSDKRGAIPADLAPILTRLQINPDQWIDTVQNFGHLFRTAIGRVDAMREQLREQVNIGIEQADCGDLIDHDTVFTDLRTRAAEIQEANSGQ